MPGRAGRRTSSHTSASYIVAKPRWKGPSPPCSVGGTKLLSSMEKPTRRRRGVMTSLVMTSMRRNLSKSRSFIHLKIHSPVDLKIKILNFIHLQRSRRMYFKRHSLMDLQRSRRMYFKYKILNLTHLQRSRRMHFKCKIFNLTHLRRSRRMDPRPRETRPCVLMDPRRGKR